MGKEINTVVGSIGTAACAVGTAATFGQCEATKQGMKNCANYTEEQFDQSIVKNTGKMVGSTVAVTATFGQIDSLNRLNNEH